MARVLITGMSATGKSSVIESLRTMGFVAIDTDVDGWRVPPDGAQPAGRRVEPEWVWDEARMSELLASRDSPLFVSGCVENQGQFYDRFDEIILLTAPVGAIVERLGSRAANSYGKTADELAAVLRHREVVEPLLRNAATHEIDTTAALEDVVELVRELGTR